MLPFILLLLCFHELSSCLICLLSVRTDVTHNAQLLNVSVEKAGMAVDRFEYKVFLGTHNRHSVTVLEAHCCLHHSLVMFAFFPGLSRLYFRSS